MSLLNSFPRPQSLPCNLRKMSLVRGISRPLPVLCNPRKMSLAISERCHYSEGLPDPYQSHAISERRHYPEGFPYPFQSHAIPERCLLQSQKDVISQGDFPISERLFLDRIFSIQTVQTFNNVVSLWFLALWNRLFLVIFKGHEFFCHTFWPPLWFFI